MEFIDLSDWQLDDQFAPYPEGSRDKYAIISPTEPAHDDILPDHRYLMKFSNARYPIQFWSELIAAIVGKHMGVRVPRCFLATDPQTGQPGSLISWFYGVGAEDDFAELNVVEAPIVGLQTGDSIAPDEAPASHSRYVPGSAYMVRYIHDYDLEKGKQHNLDTLSRFISFLRFKYKIDYWPHWLSVFTFDALIGNTDRHQDNWGVLWRKSDSDKLIPRFSPAFDNGTSLLHEIMEERLAPFLNDDDVCARYIARGRHHIREKLGEAKGMGHLQLIQELIDRRTYLVAFLDSTSGFSIDNLEEEIMSLKDVDSPVPISELRCRVICKVLRERTGKLRQLIDGRN